MEKNKTIWGGAVGKTVAFLLVIGLVCAVLACAAAYALYHDEQLLTNEIKLRSAAHDGYGTVTIRFAVDKGGYRFSGFKTERNGDWITVKLYACAAGSGAYTAENGDYTISVKVDKSVKEIVQEASNGTRSLIELDWTD